MSFVDKLDRARAVLERQGRLSTRALGRELEVADDELEELIEELVDVQQIVRRDGKVLVWAARSPTRAPDPRSEPVARTASPHPAEPADARKVVTIVFADLVGSTALHERLDPESARRFMESYYAAMRGAVESQGGTVTQLLGDGVKAVFGIPRVAEDDAIRAVRAAVAMQDDFRALADAQRGAVGKTGLRVAVNTGEVVANDRTEIIGDPVNVAARLQEQGKDGDVVVGEATHRLVSTLVTLELLGSFALKGRSEPVKAYRVASLDRPAGAGTAPFVGRVEELARLTAVYETAVEGPASALAVLIGSPGLGKSRLIDEFARRRAEAATLVRAHCDAAGGATFAPLAQALRELLGVEDGASVESLRATLEALLAPEEADRARIASGVASLLAGSPASPEETFFVIRRLLAGLAAVKPVVLVIDDLHWAEPLLLDLVEHLVQWGSGTPLLILIGARPELRDLRSSLVSPGGFVSDVLMLGGLDAGAAMRLAANVIGAADLPAAVAAKVLATSEGNPLFVGELVRMLVDEGAIERQGERWIVGANLAALEMPPTIHALLAARIERLGPDDRAVLERAAVVGRHFSRSSVAALLGRDGTQLDARLEALRRTELIERDTGWFLGEPVLRFHHVLIRDAAYRRLLKGTRAELHEQLADWIEAQVGDTPEHDETIGWHLEQAHQHRRELGPLDARGGALGERAARRLGSAGRRALARDDAPVAAGLLGRALERLAEADPTRAELALDWCEALLAGGDVATAENAIAELGRFVGDPASGGAPRLAAWHACFRGQLTVLTAPEALHATADVVAAAATELASLGDAAGEAKGHFVHALALARLGRIGACEGALDKALAAARRADDRRRANTVLAIAPLAALWGPSPVTRASGRCLDVVRVLRITQGAPAVEAVALSCQAVLEALRGRADAARRMIAAARKMVEDLGITQRLLETDVFGGLIDLLEGDAPAAERALRVAYDGLRDLGLGIDGARAAALLARALLGQDRAQEAEALSHESEALAGDDLKAAIAWRGVRAEALARRGEHATAVELAQAAVGIAAATDALLDHADARLALAAALRAAGRGRDADAEERRAIELWEAKSAVLLVERTRRSRARVAATASAPEPRTAPAPAPPRLSPATRRRITPNRATAALVPFNAAMAAGDLASFRAQLSESYEEIDHPTGASYGRDANVAAFERLMRSRDARCGLEPLATLGDALVLCRRTVSASATGGGRFDVGAYEQEAYTIAELAESGRWCRHEVFAADRLHDARVRLFARHAELLPAGPERAWAAAAERSLEIFRRAEADPDSLVEALAPDLEGVDHRHLSSHSVHGAAAYIDHLKGWRQVADDLVFRERDILALVPRAMLVSTLHTGNARHGGGAYERSFLTLFVLDDSGRFARVEWFDDDRPADALARFDALAVAVAPQRPLHRRVRDNAATRHLEHQWSAIEAHDVGAIVALNAQVKAIHHPTGATYGAPEIVTLFRGLWRGTNLRATQEILATLGESLVLFRRSASHDGVDARFGSVGPVEVEYALVFEVDEHGRAKHSEVFAADRLSDAVARLYERHAELQPEGPEKVRAAATAASFAVVRNATFDPKRLARALAPDFESVDHRPLSSWSLRGADAYLAHLRALHEVADDIEFRQLDVIALSPSAQLVRVLHTGTDRAGGGRYERPFLRLLVADTAGRLARAEWFDDDCEADALARFDEIAASGPIGAPQHAARRRVTPNAATANIERFGAAVAARDLDALADVLCEEIETLHHQTGVKYGRKGLLATWRSMFRAAEMSRRQETIASLGNTLALAHHAIRLGGFSEEHIAAVGAVDIDEVVLFEVDDSGRTRRFDIFPVEKLGDAVARLYQRHAELLPDGPERERAAATARSLAGWSGPIDPDRLATTMTPSVEMVDHRNLGTWSTRGAAEFLDHNRLQAEVATGFTGRTHGVLALAPDALLVRCTYFGIARDSGGAFENVLLQLFAFGADGLIARSELWEPDLDAEALARFEELTRADRVELGPFENAASRAWREVITAWRGRDLERFAALQPGPLRYRDHRRFFQLDLDREGFLEFTRPLLTLRSASADLELLATRGERLTLMRFTLEMEDDAVGPSAIDSLLLIETDEHGTIVAYDRWDLDDRDAALAALDARWAASEDAWHERSSQDALRALERGDWDGYVAPYAPDAIINDHRLAGFGAVHGRAFMVRAAEAMVALAPDARLSMQHVRACRRGRLTQFAWSGTRGGGAFESPFVLVAENDPDGGTVRLDSYDLQHADRALARYAELRDRPTAAEGRGTDSAAEWFENAAARTDRVLFERFNARDWPGIEALAAPELAFDERRRMLHNTCGRAVWLEQFRVLYDVPASRFTTKLLSTRGDRLSLSLHRFEGEVARGGGPLAMDDHLVLHEVDRDGRIVAIVLFDLEDVEAAHAELDARFAAGEGAAHPHVLRAFAGTQSLHASDWEGILRVQQSLFELAPDAHYRTDHLRFCSGGMLRLMTLAGTRDGGTFETPMCVIQAVDRDGRSTSADTYEIDDFDRALARFVELSRGTQAPERFANAVTRMADRFVRVTDARDWTGLADLFAADLRFDDRRPLLRMELPKEGFLAQFRVLFDVPNAHWTATPLATRGERLALFRLTLHGDVGDDGGPLEIDHLWVGGVDDDGRCDTIVLFEPGDLDAATVELDAGYVAREGSRFPHVTAVIMGQRRPFLDRHWDAFSAAHAPDVVLHDHRLLGWGTLHGVAAWTRTRQVLVELAPDTGVRVNHVALAERGAFRSLLVFGTRDGGAFELDFLRVDEIDASGRICRIDLFDADGMDAALARFAELAASGAAPAGSHVKPTAATVAFDRLMRHFDAHGDWDALRAACSRSFVWEDRRPIVGMSGDVELMIASARERVASGARHERREIIGAAGDRIAISRILWAGGPADGRFEVEFLAVFEVDAHGLCSALIFFEPDDLRAAQREAWARWAAIDPTVAEMTTYAGAVVDAWNAQDPDRMRALLSEDLVAADHRRTGIGRSEGREAYLRSVVALWELAPDSHLEAGLVWLAHAPHAGLYLCRREGVLPDGGEFVSEFLALAVVERGLTARLEVFEPDAADAALARFTELCPDPLRIPPNAVTRAWDRWCAAIAAGDWDTIAALYHPSYRSEDRRPLIRLTTDLAGMLENDRVLATDGWRPTRMLLATAGDRLALQHVLWRTGAAGGDSEIETLQLSEVDDEGRFASSATFAPGDRAEAFRELAARHLALTRPSALPQLEALRQAGRDLAGLRTALRDDFFFHDHRRTGLGRVEGADAFVHSVAALRELAPDALVGQPLYHLADEPHGTLSIAHSFGTLADGGAFESVYAMIMLYGPDGLAGVELFELDDLDAAKVRFAALRSARTS